MAFIITTTGAPGTVVIDDLGERTFVHPVVSYNLETEYTPFELSQSADLQAAITGGEITAVDGSGNPITIVGQLMDLQSAYNSSMNPEIVTDATLGAVTIKRGSAADTDNVLETKNGAGSNTFEVTGAGKVTGTDFNDVALTTGGAATNYLDATGAYSTPSGGTGTVTSITPAADSGSGTAITTSGTLTTTGGGKITTSVTGTTTTLDWDGLVVQKDTVVVQSDTGGINFTGSAITSVNTPGGTLPILEVTIDQGAGTNIGTNNLTLAGNRTLDLDGKSLGLLNASLGMAIGAATADASAILDLTSTTEGFLPPRMTTAQMTTLAATAVEGLMIFDTTTKQWMGYNGTSWVILG